MAKLLRVVERDPPVLIAERPQPPQAPLVVEFEWIRIAHGESGRCLEPKSDLPLLTVTRRPELSLFSLVEELLYITRGR